MWIQITSNSSLPSYFYKLSTLLLCRIYLSIYTDNVIRKCMKLNILIKWRIGTFRGNQMNSHSYNFLISIAEEIRCAKYENLIKNVYFIYHKTPFEFHDTIFKLNVNAIINIGVQYKYIYCNYFSCHIQVLHGATSHWASGIFSSQVLWISDCSQIVQISKKF